MFSVIICSIDENKYRKVVDNYTSLFGDVPHEIIGIHDAKSLCEGFNRGISQSKGSILIFSHDDIEILSEDFSGLITLHLESYDIVGVAGTTLLIDGNWIQAGRPYIFGQVAHYDADTGKYSVSVYNNNDRVVDNVQALDGLFFAVSRRVVEELHFDEKLFDGFHLYDLDFTFSAYLKGFKLAVCNDIAIIHYSGGNYDNQWSRYRDLFRQKYMSNLVANMKLKRPFEIVSLDSQEDVLTYCNSAYRKNPA